MPNWKTGIDWDERVKLVVAYYNARPKLRYGHAGENKALPVINELCAKEFVSQSKIMQCQGLSTDGIMTILSNVTAAIQGGGAVWAPELGGWYTTTADPYIYIVAPGFRKAWQEAISTQ